MLRPGPRSRIVTSPLIRRTGEGSVFTTTTRVPEGEYRVNSDAAPPSRDAIARSRGARWM